LVGFWWTFHAGNFICTIEIQLTGNATNSITHAWITFKENHVTIVDDFNHICLYQPDLVTGKL